jgi:hypothetical protein
MDLIVRRKKQAEFIARKFEEYLNRWHSYEAIQDDELQAWLYEKYSEVLRKRRNFDLSKPYFTPSSAGACDRELYLKIKKAQKDKDGVKPHQRRWQMIGTSIGDAVQFDLLLAEKHYEKLSGEKPPFRMARTEEGYPFFEDFVKSMKPFYHNGQQFYLFGTCDGVLLFTAPNGETVRVGLEIKSKQTSYTQTGYYSMKSPDEKHMQQIACYSLLYNVDYWIVLYVNASKKGWFMEATDVEKYPDIRAFGVYVTEDMRQQVLNKFADIMHHVNIGVPPKLDIYKFAFNKYKKACAESLTDEEFEEIKSQVTRIVKSVTTPKHIKYSVQKNFLKLEELWGK